MNTKVMAALFLDFGDLLQNQVLLKLFIRFRQHNLIQPYVETAAISCYRQAIILHPDLAQAHYKLGKLFLKQKKWSEAAVAFEKVTKIGDFNLADAYYNLGRMLSRLKRFEESAAVLYKAIELEPEQSSYYSALGGVFSQTGELSEARKNFQIALQKKIRKTHPHILLKLSSKQLLSAPSFLIIGQVKCGTSSLYHYLIQHPQILPAIRKEIQFWHINSAFNKGLDWYLSHFPAIASETHLITGEATPLYINHKLAAERIFQAFPNLKLIVLLRNPIDQVISNYYMRVRGHKEKYSLEKAIALGLENSIQPSNTELSNFYDRCYLRKGRYIEIISQWMDLFPKNQFLIVKSEDLFTDPATTVNQVFQFLGVEPYQLQKYSQITKGIYPSVSPSMYQTLSEYFRPYNKQLEAYLERDFNWK